jgi:hypothetical protein
LASIFAKAIIHSSQILLLENLSRTQSLNQPVFPNDFVKAIIHSSQILFSIKEISVHIFNQFVLDSISAKYSIH